MMDDYDGRNYGRTTMDDKVEVSGGEVGVVDDVGSIYSYVQVSVSNGRH